MPAQNSCSFAPSDEIVVRLAATGPTTADFYVFDQASGKLADQLTSENVGGIDW